MKIFISQNGIKHQLPLICMKKNFWHSQTKKLTSKNKTQRENIVKNYQQNIIELQDNFNGLTSMHNWHLQRKEEC